MTVLVSRTLGDLVTEAPGRALVLDRLELDYCCHGGRTLEEACREAGLDPEVVIAALDSADATDSTDEVDHPTEPAELVDHIERTHHRYLHTELPELAALAEKVASVHGERHGELREVEALVGALRADLEPHLAKEEQVLFPAIRALVAGGSDFPFGTVANPIRVMSVEHEAAGELLSRLRTAADGYRVPDDACASYRSLYERLEHLEADTHRHIHLENNVLFPAALAIQPA